MHVDAVGEAELVGKPASTMAQDTHGVRLVQHEDRAEFLFQVHDVAQRRDVAVHAEDRFRDDEDAGLRILFARPAQVVAEFGHVVVREGAVNCAAQTRAVDQTSVAQAVEENDIALAGQRLQCADAGRCSAAEEERGLGALEHCECFLQLRVGGLCSGDQTRGARSGAVISRGADGRLDHVVMRGEAEVII